MFGDILRMLIGSDHHGNTHLDSCRVELLALHNPRPELGHKTFITIVKLSKEKFSNYGTKNSIPKILKALIIDPVSIA